MRKNLRPAPDNGFTLIELTVVLIIVSLMIGSLMIPLSTQQAIRDRTETDRRLNDIRTALIGYAIINGRLPCPMPDTVINPANAAYGVAPISCSPSAEGYLPWKSLGVEETDAWGQKRTATTDPFVGHWRYRVQENYTNADFKAALTATSDSKLGFFIPPIVGGTLTEFSVADSAGNLLHVTASNKGEPPVAVIYSKGQKDGAQGKNADADPNTYQAGEPSSSFDDQLIWISRPYLISRLAAVGKL